MLSFFKLKGKFAFDKYHSGFFSSNEETSLQITIFFSIVDWQTDLQTAAYPPKQCLLELLSLNC